MTKMVASVVLLAIAGVCALWSVIWAVNAPTKGIRPTFPCDSLSPDGEYRCMDTMAHVGWCHNRDIEWRYESWAIGADDHTRQATPAEVREPATALMIGTRKRLPKAAILAGVLAIAAVYNLAYDTTHPKQATPKYDCNWQVVRCVDGTTR